MQKTYTLIIYLFAFSIFGVCSAQTFDPDYLDGSLYLKVKDTSSVDLAPYNNGIPALNLIITTFGVDSIYHPFQNPDASLQKIYRFEYTNIMGANNLVTQLQALNFVEYAEKVPLIQTTGTNYIPNDQQASQWGLNKIQAPLAWDLVTGSSQVVVAIVDNAFLTTHEDLANVYYINTGEIPNNFLDEDLNGTIDDVMGFDVADTDPDVNPAAATPDWDHGTHCAGITGAETDNGLGIASIGFGIKVMPIKASSSLTAGNTLEKAYEGVDYAMNNGADVISMSWGSKGNSLTGDLILNVARNNNIVLIAAAGNNNDSIPFYPAAYANTLSVGATDFSDWRSNFSNYGSYIDVMAPGTDIFSSLADATNSYGNLSGTSMACPMVAGLAGLILSSGSMPEATVKQVIIDGCDNIDALNPGFAGKLGAGRINAFNSLNQVVAVRADLAPNLVKIYPNPSQDFFSVSIPESIGSSAMFKLFDLSGKLVLETELNASVVRIEGYVLPKGLYLATIESESQRVTQKLVIE